MESPGASVAYCFEGNVADMGDSSPFALEASVLEDRSPSNPRPTG